MPRTKSDRPEFQFSGNFFEAMDLINGGIRPDGLRLNQQEYNQIKSHLIGRNGIMTVAKNTLQQMIKESEPRSLEKFNLQSELVKLNERIAKIRNAASSASSQISLNRAENAIERIQRKGENTKIRFLRDYEFLTSTDPEFIDSFLDDPAKMIASMESEIHAESSN